MARFQPIQEVINWREMRDLNLHSSNQVPHIDNQYIMRFSQQCINLFAKHNIKYILTVETCQLNAFETNRMDVLPVRCNSITYHKKFGTLPLTLSRQLLFLAQGVASFFPRHKSIRPLDMHGILKKRQNHYLLNA